MDDTGTPNGSMGADVADYNGSGNASIFVTNFQDEFHAPVSKHGQRALVYQTYQAGLSALGRHLVGFGTSFIDIDNDGWEDIVFVNGHVFQRPSNSTHKQVPVLLRNVAGGRQAGFPGLEQARRRVLCNAGRRPRSGGRRSRQRRLAR